MEKQSEASEPSLRWPRTLPFGKQTAIRATSQTEHQTNSLSQITLKRSLPFPYSDEDGQCRSSDGWFDDDHGRPLKRVMNEASPRKTRSMPQAQAEAPAVTTKVPSKWLGSIWIDLRGHTHSSSQEGQDTQVDKRSEKDEEEEITVLDTSFDDQASESDICPKERSVGRLSCASFSFHDLSISLPLFETPLYRHVSRLILLQSRLHNWYDLPNLSHSAQDPR